MPRGEGMKDPADHLCFGLDDPTAAAYLRTIWGLLEDDVIAIAEPAT